MDVPGASEDAADWSSEGYRSIFENAPVGIYRSTTDGRLIGANPALVALNGYDSQEQMLADLRERGNEWYVAPGRRDEFHRLMAQRGEARHFVSEVYRMRTRERIWVCENAWTVRDARGRIRHFEGTVEDVTVQRMAHDRILQASDSLRTSQAKESHFNSLHRSFASIVAHQFRTPLAIIDSAAQRAARATELPADELARRMQRIRAAVRRMNHLLDSVLSTARFEAGEILVVPRRTNLHALIEETVDEVREWNPEVVVDVCLAGLPAAADVDPTLVEQALYNVLSNSVKYSLNNSSVSVRGGAIPGFAVVSVVDQGIGIDADEIPGLFQRFFRARSAAGIAGTGLGLSIARDLIRLHGGDVTVASVRHQGTTVTLTLPVGEAGRCD